MKKFLLLITMLLMLSSTCMAERSFPDGTVLNDKETEVYGHVERIAYSFIEPSSIRFRGVDSTIDACFDDYMRGDSFISIAISAKNSMGGRIVKTYSIYHNGEIAMISDGALKWTSRDVDCVKLNQLWKTYHSDED